MVLAPSSSTAYLAIIILLLLLPIGCGGGHQDSVGANDASGLTDAGEADGDTGLNSADDAAVDDAEPGDVVDEADAAEDSGVSDDASAPTPRCGDGHTDFGEECDDGNVDERDGCSNACLLPFCGDRQVHHQPLTTEMFTLDFEDDREPRVPEGDAWFRFARDDFAGHALRHARIAVDGETEVVWREVSAQGTNTLRFEQFQDFGSRARIVLRSPTGEVRTLLQPRPFEYWHPVSVEFFDREGGSDLIWHVANEDLDARFLVYWLDNVSLTHHYNAYEECDLGDDNDDDGGQCRTDCTVPRCGDGILDLREECEPTLSRECTNECTLAVCGNGSVEGTEQCDEGERNSDAADACRTDCRAPTCGDGIIDSGEDCDEPSDLCSWRCLDVVCGDGRREGDEQCDDGELNGSTADACSLTCEEPRCGDARVGTGEECDDGNANNEDGCRNTCVLPVCGDTLLDPGEECDDGNFDERDGCDSACRGPRCGDGITNLSEVCDLGDVSLENACLAPCPVGVCGDEQRGLSDAQVTIANPRVRVFGADYLVGERQDACPCGLICLDEFEPAPENGVCQWLGFEHVVAYEYGAVSSTGSNTGVHVDDWQCDAAGCRFLAAGLSDLATSRILVSITCEGEAVEQCDEGLANAHEPDQCRPDCRAPRCGDGVRDTGEQCDDGNLDNGDACTNECREAACGDGYLQDGELCDDGAANGRASGACRANCEPARCGDGIADIAPRGRLPAGVATQYEQCDDGNTNDDDDCTNDCRLGTCGDGVLDGGEECNNPGDTWDWESGFYSGCYPGCFGSYCGDGFVDPHEQCEPPGIGDCRSDCLARNDWTPPDDTCRDGACCGDGVVDRWYEDCEPRWPEDPLCSSVWCTEDTCGDGILQTGTATPWREWTLEVCDDDAIAQGWTGVRESPAEPWMRSLSSTGEREALELAITTRSAFRDTARFDVMFEYRFESAVAGDSLSLMDAELPAVAEWTSTTVRGSLRGAVRFEANWSSDERRDASAVQIRRVRAREVPGQGEECDWGDGRDAERCSNYCQLYE